MHVTVCVCTRDRGDSVLTALRSILASDYEDFDIVVVDQSTGDDTADAVSAIMSDGTQNTSITYLRSYSRGSSVAHNVAIAHARGPLLAFTDDDCVVTASWLTRLVAYFQDYPEVGLIYGSVLPGPHDPSAGFIPTAYMPRLKCITSPWMKWRESGIGANMALRRKTLEHVGPFDEALGAGGRLYACLDGDMTYRVLHAGYAVLNVPDADVIHYGFRPWQEGQPMMRRVGIGVGATYMKHLLLGDVAVLPTLFIEWMRCLDWRRVLFLRPHSGVARFIAYAHGMRLSWTYAKDPVTRTYIPPNEGQAVADMSTVDRAHATREVTSG